MKKYIAEFIGTMVLVLFACGTAAVTGCTNAADVSYLLTAIAFGLVIVAMAYSIGNISGCHINPAVSIAMLVLKKIKPADFIGYIAAQFLGAFAGAEILAGLIGTGMGLGTNGLYQDSILKSLAVEVILTFVFVFTILGVTSKEKNAKIAGLVIGFTLTLVHIFGIYFTGTSVNPARSFGPALAMALSGNMKAIGVVWVFIAAPLTGGVLAALIWQGIKPKEEN